MAERSFTKEIALLELGTGDTFRGEGILAVTKALLQSGVSYVGGYQGAPVSHLMDVMADANDLLAGLGIHFQACASEASAAAMLGASVNYPIRGAVTWKSTVGTNVASDALANLSSSGVKGGSVIIIGEDYGEGASIMQERSHAFAMKSQIWLLDPRPNLPMIVETVEKAFELSEASNTPVMVELRIRACHVTGEFEAKDNRIPVHSRNNPIQDPSFDFGNIVLPPSTYAQEKKKVDVRMPAAIEFVKQHQLNEVFDGGYDDIGIITQGGLYNAVMRSLAELGLADAFGNTDVPIYVMNVTYPVHRRRDLGFLRRQACSARGRRSAAPTTSSKLSTSPSAKPISTPRLSARTFCRWPASTRSRWSSPASPSSLRVRCRAVSTPRACRKRCTP